AQDVGQLERDAEFEGVVVGAGMTAAEDANTDEANRRRDTAAVLDEVVERRVTRLLKIHRHAVDHVLERLTRQIEGSNRRLQRAPLRRPRLAFPVDRRKL